MSRIAVPASNWLSGLFALALAAAVSGFDAPAWAEEVPRRIVVFDFELIDTSGQGEVPEEKARLSRVGELVRGKLDGAPEYRVVDLAPAREAIAAAGEIRSCNGCELDIGRALGADLVLVGTVQKVSNLILNMNAVMREVETGDIVRAASVDIRGNTEESWLRGASYLVRHRLLERAATSAPR